MTNHINILLIALATLSTISCNRNSDMPLDPVISEEEMYFPPIDSDEWESISIETLGWNIDKLNDLNQFLIEEDSKSFIVLKNGRIVVEEYFNNHNASKTWQWNSAGKTLVTATTGIAQNQGLVDIEQNVSSYLGEGWTSMPLDKEKLITPKHLLTMTSGVDDLSNLVIPATLKYLADAGTRWSYHNVFQLLMNIVSETSGQQFQYYFDKNLSDQIGMNGFWNFGSIFKIYHSDSRSMARFGLLALNNGKWEEKQVIDQLFMQESTTTSQELNPSYGYMWWLNGKSSFMLPGGQERYQNILVPNAPRDMYAAMGKDEQRIYVIPSENMVIIRMGNATTPNTTNNALSSFDNEFWKKFNEVIN